MIMKDSDSFNGFTDDSVYTQRIGSEICNSWKISLNWYNQKLVIFVLHEFQLLLWLLAVGPIILLFAKRSSSKICIKLA